MEIFQIREVLRCEFLHICFVLFSFPSIYRALSAQISFFQAFCTQLCFTELWVLFVPRMSILNTSKLPTWVQFPILTPFLLLFLILASCIKYNGPKSGFPGAVRRYGIGEEDRRKSRTILQLGWETSEQERPGESILFSNFIYSELISFALNFRVDSPLVLRGEEQAGFLVHQQGRASLLGAMAR